MNIQSVQKNDKPKTKRLNLRISEATSKWMKEHKVSPQKVFDQASSELMGVKKK